MKPANAVFAAWVMLACACAGAVGKRSAGMSTAESIAAYEGTAEAARNPAENVVEAPKDMKLVLLVGQSNMSGRAPVTDEFKKPIDRCYNLNRDGKWTVATNPFHFDRRFCGVGPGDEFARRYLADHPGETLGLVPCAVGGSPLSSWLPVEDGKNGVNFRKALKRAKIAQANGTFVAILWHQGETDTARSSADKLMEYYPKGFSEMVVAFRAELGLDDKVPVVVGEIGRWMRRDGDHAAKFDPVIHECARRVPRCACVSTEGLKNQDQHHFDGPAVKALGGRYYDAWKSLSRDVAPCEANICAFPLQGEIDAAAAKGGGRVVVPPGEHFSDGPIRLRSNVELHLEDGAKIVFSDDPQKYLPSVPTSWEGVECLNYSPLVYAYGCTNVAITGKGTIAPKMGFWRKWFGRGKGHMEATRRLYDWCSFNAPMEDRDLTKIPESNVRPHLIQFNRCKNIRLEGFKIRESPFWTIHLFLCDGAIVRGLDVYAHGHNNDGVDIEMTRNVLVENCRFDQGDDAVVIKSGRNQDAWRLATPSENIEVRNCTVVNGHVLLGVGSEMSGGVRNVWMHDCVLESEALRLFYVKTNERRGGFVENIRMENVKAKKVRHGVMEVETDVLYQWRDFPTHEVRVTPIRNLSMKDVTVEEAARLVHIIGDRRNPVDGVRLDNVRASKVHKADQIENAVNVSVNAGDGR